MRNLLVVLAGFIIGGAAVAAVAFALPRTTTSMPSSHMGSGAAPSGMMSGSIRTGMMSGSARNATSSAAAVKLTIQHVQKGCHVWSNGKTTAAMMRLHLMAGQKLSITDMDVDAHQMMEFSGPMHMRMGGPMTMSRSMTLAFTKKGTYRLGTKTVEMPGGGMDVKTIGPDNNLRLIVTVA